MRLRIGKWILWIVPVMIFLWLGRELWDATSEKRRLQSSFRISKELLSYYQTENGKLAARSEIYELRYREVKKIFPEILSEIQNLKVNPGKVNHYSETVITQQKQIIRQLKDSLIFDSIRMKTFNYMDEFYKVQGDIMDDSIRISIHSVDSIIQIVYKGKRYNPWLWVLSRRRLEQAITSKNPSSRIEYSKTIQLSK